MTKDYDHTWAVLIRHYLNTLWENDGKKRADAYVGMISEAGLPPVIKDDEEYTINSEVEYHYPVKGCNFEVDGMWFGWRNDDSTKENLRCSLTQFNTTPKGNKPQFRRGAISVQEAYDLTKLDTDKSIDVKHIRPVPVLEIVSDTKRLNVALVHLLSGAGNFNIKLLQGLMNYLSALGTPTIIAGDMNINLSDFNTMTNVQTLINENRDWYMLSFDCPTSRSGNELDWAVFYKCKVAEIGMPGPLSNSGAGNGFGIVAKGISDHAIMGYVIEV